MLFIKVEEESLMKKVPIYYDEISSPVGPITMMTHEDQLIRLDFGTIDEIQDKATHYLSRIGNSFRFIPANLNHVAKQELTNYFTKQHFDFSWSYVFYGTPFQQDVWQVLLRIPPGKTVSYKDIAEWIGRPKAARAVGGAVNKNPFSIVVPCHRVIGANGALIGYGGGLERKEFLLAHEEAMNFLSK